MPGELVEVEDARRAVLERVRALPAEQVPLREALGRVLAEDVVAPEPVPGFDNSAMDGYAVRAADTARVPVRLRLVGESRAGHPAEAAVGEGETIAISTGAMVPDGADAVVRLEDTGPDGDGVEVRAAAAPGLNVRRAGEDVEAGEAVLRAGTAIGAAEQGVLASAARDAVRCGRRPRVSVVVSGDELVGPGDPIRPGAVRDSNAYTVPALAAGAGAEVFSVEHVGDDPGETLAALDRALGSDVAIVCGGVSVGPHDHVRPALAELGAREVFWGVALRPGKPTWFGEGPSGLAFGLPGNPVSAMVTFILFARPALLAMQGREPGAVRSRARLGAGYEKKPGRAHAVRSRLELTLGGLVAWPTGPQGSHVLTSMLGADALAILPAPAAAAAAGDEVEVELLPGSTMAT
ncbi:MAG TPA: gephyrin-like molybdotransferase Glp [Solirubrobacterales bacterium]|nr:gephyrin-like molybdotransferase Glp [Solirubrobacterales bacterium]